MEHNRTVCFRVTEFHRSRTDSNNGIPLSQVSSRDKCRRAVTCTRLPIRDAAPRDEIQENAESGGDTRWKSLFGIVFAQSSETAPVTRSKLPSRACSPLKATEKSAEIASGEAAIVIRGTTGETRGNLSLLFP